MWLYAVLVLALVSSYSCLNNGLGLVPPMGWLSWLRYRCTIDCKNYPNDCISEKLIMDMADSMAAEYAQFGYEYVMIDDCWFAPERASNGSLLPDPIRFPRGINFLTDYIHSKGLKFGIYEDYGSKTCAGYPGSEGYLQIDASTFARWGVDYVKFDGCNSNPNDQPIGCKNFSLFLNETSRPIFLNVEWPFYVDVRNVDNNLAQLLVNTTNMARVFDDIDDNWNSLHSVINFYIMNYNNFASWAGPGHYNDPDMLLLGNNYITPQQEQLQMTMWAMFAAPLIMSNDLRNVSPASKSILTNRNIIAINQDPLGIQARMVNIINNVHYWIKPLVNNRVAIAITNLNDKNVYVSFSLNQLGLSGGKKYLLTEVYNMVIHYDVDIFTSINFSMEPTSAVIFECQLFNDD